MRTKPLLLLQTASTLVVAEAKSSGIYSCVASNKVGKSERNVSFIVTGKIYSSVESNMFPDPGITTVRLLWLFNIPQNCCNICTCKLIPCFWVMLLSFTAAGLDFKGHQIGEWLIPPSSIRHDRNYSQMQQWVTPHFGSSLQSFHTWNFSVFLPTSKPVSCVTLMVSTAPFCSPPGYFTTQCLEQCQCLHGAGDFWGYPSQISGTMATYSWKSVRVQTTEFCFLFWERQPGMSFVPRHK